MNRLLLGSVLVACLLVLCTYHASYHDLHEAYPGNEEVINGVEGTVSVYGTVLDTGGDGFTLRLTHGSASRIVTVVSSESVARGDKVEALGILNGNELIPNDMIVLKQWSHYAVYLRSVVGLAIAVIVFLRYWTFDVKRLRFSRRTRRDGGAGEVKEMIKNA
ncbi:MAG: hypothetical protein ACP5E9_07705 [Candidatus Methanospirareceae archaeon]